MYVKMWIPSLNVLACYKTIIVSISVSINQRTFYSVGQSKIAKVRIARSVATTYLKPRTSPRIGRGLFEECREGCSYEERREVAESIIEETNEYREEVSENY